MSVIIPGPDLAHAQDLNYCGSTCPQQMMWQAADRGTWHIAGATLTGKAESLQQLQAKLQSAQEAAQQAKKARKTLQVLLPSHSV